MKKYECNGYGYTETECYFFNTSYLAYLTEVVKSVYSEEVEVWVKYIYIMI